MAGAGAAPLQPGADDPVAADGTPAAGDALTKIPEDHPVASGPKKARRPRLPEHLPIVREVIDPDAVLANPAAFRFVNEVITEQLDFVRGRFQRRHIVRRQFVPIANPDAAPIIAPLAILQERCLAAPALLANIITAKYCDALPLYRQEQPERSGDSQDRGKPRFFAWGTRSLPREILENPLGADARLREILKFTRDQRLSSRDSDDDPWENRFSPTDSNRAPRDSSSVPWEMRVSPWEKAPDSKELARFPLPNELIPFREIRFARFCGLIV